jgi:hypothetical protein
MLFLDKDAHQEVLTTAMLNSVEGAFAGFYFEEGGCWGMAQALHEQLLRANIDAKIMYRAKGFVHAWVQVGDRAIDHQGVSLAPKDSAQVNAKDLQALAESYGIEETQFIDDVLWATQIVDNAWAQVEQALGASALEGTTYAVVVQGTETEVQKEAKLLTDELATN